MSAGHTPGPWIASSDCEWSIDTDGSNAFTFVGPDGEDPVAIVVVTDSFGLDDTLDANIALIAAAPDLLDGSEFALPLFREMLARSGTLLTEAGSAQLEAWAAAIAKATGATA